MSLGFSSIHNPGRSISGDRKTVASVTLRGNEQRVFRAAAGSWQDESGELSAEAAVVPSIAGITGAVKQMVLFLHKEERLSREAAIGRGAGGKRLGIHQHLQFIKQLRTRTRVLE